MLKYFLAVILLFNALLVWGKAKSPSQFNTYDGTAPGARPLAMGYAFCAVGEEPSAVYFNPAGLYSIKDNYISFSYEIARKSSLSTGELFSSEVLRNNKLIFFSINSAKGSFSWRPLANYTYRTENGNDWQENEIRINAFTFSVTTNDKDKIFYGLNLSYLNGRIGQAAVENNIPDTNIADGNGIACDFGAIYMISDEFRFGFNMQNLASFMWWDDYTKDQLPFGLRLGMAFQIAGFMTFASDWDKKYYRDADGPVESTYFGLEQALGKILVLRAGIFGQDLSDNEKTHLSMGLGYYRKNYSFSLSGEKYRFSGSDVFRYLFSLDMPI